MSEGNSPIEDDNIVPNELANTEQRLYAETGVIALMKEQMTSMIGMVIMFVVTIFLALFIRPWYDVAELHAFGEAGATQVRFVLLELVLIFIFTACVIMLARYKKEWLIKYGIMGVLTIALMYTTVPLMHMLVIDFEVEEFTYQDTFSYEGDYLTDYGMNGFFTHQLQGNFTNWQDSVSFWGEDNIASGQPSWTMNFPRYPAGDNELFRYVKSDDYITFANSAWIWSVDITTGEELERYSCNYLDGELVNLGTEYGSCEMAIIVDGGVYTLSTDRDLVFYRTYDESPGQLFYQADWAVPPQYDIRNGFIDAGLVDADRFLLVTEQVVGVIKLEKTKDTLATIPATFEFEFNPQTNITSSDFGHSIWSKENISSNTGDKKLLIIGEEDGNITSWEWDNNLAVGEQFTIQDKMKLAYFTDGVVQIQLTDLDESGFTDILVISHGETNWFYGQSLKNLFTAKSEDFSQHSYFVTNDSTTILVSLSNDSIATGIIDDNMFSLDGLQLYDVPFLIGVVIALLLMVLLYFHSEWYVVNTVGILVGAGVIVMLGVAFVPGLIIIFMILAAIYDAWAVYRSKHMLELADTMIGLQLPILLVAPQDKGYSFKEDASKMVDKSKLVDSETVTLDPNPPRKITNPTKTKSNKEALFMGLGDIIFPGMLVLSAVQWLESDNSFIIAIFTLVGSLLGYLALMTYVARGKAQAGLPLLNGGAIVGYFVGGLIFIGTGIFDLGISF